MTKFRVILFFLFITSVSLQGATDLTLWIDGDNSRAAVITGRIVKQFEAETGLTVEIKKMSSGKGYDEAADALTSSAKVNIIQLDPAWIPRFVKMGYLADLSYFENSISASRFPDNVLSPFRPSGSNRLYAVPWSMNVRLLFLNKKYADRIDFTPADAAAYENFRDFLYRLKDASFSVDNLIPVYPFGFPGRQDSQIIDNFSPWVWSEGGSFVEMRNQKIKSNIMHQNTIMGIYRYLSFAREELHSPGALKLTSDLILDHFLDEEYAVIASGSDLIGKLTVSAEDGGYGGSKLARSGYYVMKFPEGTMDSTTLLKISALGIPKGFANDVNTLKLLFYLTNRDNMDTYCRAIGQLPPDTTLWDKWRENPHYQAALEAAEGGRLYPGDPDRMQIDRILALMFQDIWSMIESDSYSDEQLFTIMTESEAELSKLLRNPGTALDMSKETFLSIINEYDYEYTRPRYESPLSNPTLLITLLSILGLLLLISIVIILITGKRAE